MFVGAMVTTSGAWRPMFFTRESNKKTKKPPVGEPAA
jgi:hypothetical protein